MNTTIKEVVISEDLLSAVLRDGRIISVPLAWYPQLLNAATETRNKFRLIGGGVGIHWPEIDEDISLRGMLSGISYNQKVA